MCINTNLQFKLKKKKIFDMKKIAFILLFMFVSLHAGLEYSVNAPLLGKIATLKITNKYNKHRYTIKITLIATGVGKSMTGGLIEYHTSKGTVKRGVMFAKEYTIEKYYEDIKYLKKYSFNYSNKKIKKTFKKWKSGKIIREEGKELSYFSTNDMLTTYHNIMKYKKKKKAGEYSISVAGAERIGGKLRFVIPDKNQKRKMLDKLDVNLEYEAMKLFLGRSYFKNGKGNLIFAIAKNGIAKKITLNNIKLFGTVTLKRIK